MSRGRPEGRRLPGDDLLRGAARQATHAVVIDAPPERVWPWLAQMGRGRAGFYAVDLLDNGGARSARELDPELPALSAGDVITAGPRGRASVEVLVADPPRALVLGALWDVRDRRGLPFSAPRPERHWLVTWAFALEPLDGRRTRLTARARVAYPSSDRLHAVWARPAHHVMQTIQLRNVARRAEGRLAANDWRDLLAAADGLGRMGLALVTPFRRGRRARWGAGDGQGRRHYPGDELVPDPSWGWTHAVEVGAPAAEVWPWIAQIGADRAGFYSYSWLENLAGCRVRDAERVHPEWEAREGAGLSVHPSMPPLRLASVERGRHVLAHGPPDEAARAAGRPWAAVTWLFLVEPLGPDRSRVVSRYRCAHSADLRTRLGFGPALVEPVSFAMDRRMLLGIRRRAEGRRSARG